MAVLIAAIDWTPIAAACLGGSALIGLAALRKVPQENDRIIVSAAEGLHTIQSGVIDALQEEVSRNRDRAENAERRRDAAETERDRCRQRIDELAAEVDDLKGQVRDLRRRLD